MKSYNVLLVSFARARDHIQPQDCPLGAGGCFSVMGNDLEGWENGENGGKRNNGVLVNFYFLFF
jgi:hypothetical protein